MELPFVLVAVGSDGLRRVQVVCDEDHSRAGYQLYEKIRPQLNALEASAMRKPAGKGRTSR